MRIALGYDSHRLKEGCGLMLGGVFLECSFSIEGAHSDGDVLLHALTDVLLSPLGTDIGIEFPNTSPKWKDTESSTFVRHALDMLKKKYEIINIDMLVICDSPKISPYSETIKLKIASLLGIGVSQLSLKGKTSEGAFPFIIQAYCNALFNEKL